jgi:hypothetical protein
MLKRRFEIVVIHVAMIIHKHGIGRVLFNDGVIPADKDILSALISALSMFVTQLGDQQSFFREAEFGRYKILIHQRGDYLWVLVQDVYDNISLAEKRLAQITSLLADKIDPLSEEEFQEEFDLKDDQVIHLFNIIKSQEFPREKLAEIGRRISVLMGQESGNIFLSDIFIADLDGGLIAEYSASKNPLVLKAFMGLLATIPYERSIWLEAFLNPEKQPSPGAFLGLEIEGWAIQRIEDTNFIVMARGFYATGYRGLYQHLLRRAVQEIARLIKK